MVNRVGSRGENWQVDPLLRHNNNNNNENNNTLLGIIICDMVFPHQEV